MQNIHAQSARICTARARKIYANDHAQYAKNMKKQSRNMQEIRKKYAKNAQYAKNMQNLEYAKKYAKICII